MADSLADPFAELMARIEDDPRFDVERHLREHPEQASVVRARLDKLRRAGLLGAAGREGSILRAMEERFGIAAPPEDAREELPAASGELLPSRVVGGRYRVRAEIGRGGMGRVFRARDVDLGRDVALKVIDLGASGAPDTPRRRALVERFLAEARVTAQLEHPSIVPLHDVGVDRTGELFYTMKLVEGRTLESLIDGWHGSGSGGASLPIPELLRLVLRICDALALAHERGVIHRDLKPSNVMVGRFGEVHVMDWGLAKALGSTDAPAAGEHAPTARGESPTGAGDVLGTPSHMAPEQASGAPVDRRTDVYGVGAILHHALTGEPPNRQPGPGAPGERRAAGAGLDARGIPKPLRCVVRKALEQAPDERYATVRALADDVEAFLEDRQGNAWRDPRLVRAAKLVHRHPTRSAVGVALAVLLPLALFGWKQRALLRLKAESLAEAELRESDAETVRRLRDLRQRYGFETPSGPIDHIASARAHLGLFAERVVRIDGERPIAEVGANLAVVCARDPELGRAALDSLYDLAHMLYATRIAHGVWLETRPGIPILDATEEQGAREAARNHPELAAVWPRIGPLVDACENDAWRRATWHEWWRVLSGDAPEIGLDRYLEEAELSGKDASQLVHLAQLVFTVRGAGRAERVYQRAETVDPSLFWPHVALGMMAFERRDMNEARRQYEMALALNPGMGRVHSTLCGVYSDLDLTDLALAAGRRGIELIPESPTARYNLGLAMLEAGRYEASAALLREAVALDPAYVKAWHALGQALFGTRRIEESLRACQEALRIDPQATDALRLAGTVLWQRPEIDLALPLFEQAAALDPGFFEIWLDALEVSAMLERALALATTVPAADPATAAKRPSPELLRPQIERLLSSAPPADEKERVWLAMNRLYRCETLASAELFEPILTALMASEDPRATAAETGNAPTVLAWRACQAAARAATGRGYQLVEGAALLERGDPDLLLDGVAMPRVAPSERPSVSDHLRTHPGDADRLAGLAADGLELWTELVRADAESAAPELTDGHRLFNLRDVLYEPALRELGQRERIARALAELERWRDELEAAGAGGP